MEIFFVGALDFVLLETIDHFLKKRDRTLNLNDILICPWRSSTWTEEWMKTP